MPDSVFQQLLDPRIITAIWEQIPGVLDLHFTNYWSNAGTPEEVPTDQYELIAFNTIMQPGPGNLRDGTAKVVVGPGATKRLGNMFRYFVERPMGSDCIRALREPDSLALQKMGATLINRAAKEESWRWQLFKEIVLSQIFHCGRVNMDAAGNLLQPSVNTTSGAITNASGTAIAADFAVANSHRGNLGGIISALWSVAGTKIGDQLDLIRRQAAIAGVPRPTEIRVNGAYGRGYLRNNTQFQAWAAYGASPGQSDAVDAVLRGDMIKNLWGFDWYFVDGVWTDVNGATQDLIPQDRAIITPPMGPWLSTANGLEEVPTQVGLFSDMMAAINSFDEAYGRFVYWQVMHNPGRLSGFFGDNFGMNFSDPNAIWMPSVF